jgi:hypothetical protein
MKFRIELLHSKRGLETVTAVLMLLLMFAVIIGLVAAFFNYNSSAQEQMNIEQVRSQEQIILTSQFVENGRLMVTISNTGTTDVTVRALYKVLNGQVTFYCDPSTYMDTHISVGVSLNVSFPSGVVLGPQEKIVAATERAVKTLDYFTPPPTPNSTFVPNPNKFTYGDLELEWLEFLYQGVTSLPPGSNWLPGWVVPPQTYTVWKLTIKNIGNRTIMLNSNSSFVTVPSNTPGHPSGKQDILSWYLYSGINQPQTATLPVNVTAVVEFAWASPNPNGNYNQVNQVEKTYSGECTAMVFLTFFGSYWDGSPYAQTVPFEAAITVTG